MADERCLIFQRDHGILLSTGSPGFETARDELRRFCELVQSAGGYQLYRPTDVTLWSAAASGAAAAELVATLDRFGQHPPPATLVSFVQEVVSRYGRLRLEGEPGSLRLVADDTLLLRGLAVQLRLSETPEGDCFLVPDERRGAVKRELAARGYPVADQAALALGGPVAMALRPEVALRPYQRRAVDRFVEQDWPGALVLLPCGAGKTMVGVAAAVRLGTRTLVLSPSRTVGEQWIEQFRRLTTLRGAQVGSYRRGATQTEVTVATYQAVTAGGGAGLGELLDVPWGLIIYDEVHTLPAEVFRLCASLQSRRRLGLTATLVREDGRERDVFALVGPPVFSAPWRELERQGWIAPVACVEVRVALAEGREPTEARQLSAKLAAARRILASHPDAPALLIAHRLQEVAALSRASDAPMITGQTPAAERRRLYEAFRRGDIRRLAVSRVANLGVDLPGASVVVQLSGAFGSRQEEAQRVGRLLRPKEGGAGAVFYSLVGPAPREREFAARRQRFLVDQGYQYRIVAGADIGVSSAGLP